MYFRRASNLHHFTCVDSCDASLLCSLLEQMAVCWQSRSSKPSARRPVHQEGLGGRGPSFRALCSSRMLYMLTRGLALGPSCARRLAACVHTQACSSTACMVVAAWACLACCAQHRRIVMRVPCLLAPTSTASITTSCPRPATSIDDTSPESARSMPRVSLPRSSSPGLRVRAWGVPV